MKTAGRNLIVALVVMLATGCTSAPDAEMVSAAGGRSAHEPLPAAEAAPDPMALGRIDAPLALVEFSDYQCPYCVRFHAEVLPRLKSAYIDTGRLVVVHKDLPLAMHPQALPAAIAARCAAAQGKFWEMNEALFANSSRLGAELYPRLAQALALDGEKFQACLTDRATRTQVQRDAADARRFNISGTPGFVIGRREGTGMRVQSIARGFADFDTFAREIDQLLAAPVR